MEKWEKRCWHEKRKKRKEKKSKIKLAKVYSGTLQHVCELGRAKGMPSAKVRRLKRVVLYVRATCSIARYCFGALQAPSIVLMCVSAHHCHHGDGRASHRMCCLYIRSIDYLIGHRAWSSWSSWSSWSIEHRASSAHSTAQRLQDVRKFVYRVGYPTRTATIDKDYRL